VDQVVALAGERSLTYVYIPHSVDYCSNRLQVSMCFHTPADIDCGKNRTFDLLIEVCGANVDKGSVHARKMHSRRANPLCILQGCPILQHSHPSCALPCSHGAHDA